MERNDIQDHEAQVFTFVGVFVEQQGRHEVLVDDVYSVGNLLLCALAGRPDAVQVVCGLQAAHQRVAAAAPQTLQPKAAGHHLMVHLGWGEGGIADYSIIVLVVILRQICLLSIIY